LWYNLTMSNVKGQFVKGERASRATEFQPGQHWRPQRPYWDAEWLRAEYVTKQRTAADIAAEFGITENAILFWLRKHGIPGRSMRAVRAAKHWGLAGAANGMYGKRGAEVPNWKGGCTPERQAFYTSLAWAAACVEVWHRDNAQCQRCGIDSSEHKLHIHHIVSFAVKELRAESSNLVLLCVRCHRFVHSKQNTTAEFVREGGAKNGG
jgi:hypothetical protein